MRGTALLLKLGASVAVATCVLANVRDASACGGCFHPPTQTVTDITDERMLLAVSTTQSTLYDQIEYSGTPSNFAWVLPIHGTVTVGLSADVLFDSIDTLTATQISPPPSSCPGLPAGCNAFFGAGNASGPLSFADGGAAVPAVTVTKQENVGPYATVQLHSTDPTALNAWLTSNGYNIPSDAQTVIGQYISEGFDFLAMKLLPNQGVQAMRPVRVTTQGASLSLPLRMASIGTGATVGISIWVVSDGRYEPSNFPFFHIEDSQLVWDWSKSQSNYTTLRANAEAAGQNKTWEIESSIDLNEMTITNVIESGGQYYGPGYGGGIAVADPANDYLPTGDPDAGADSGSDSGTETAEQVRADDIAALFAGLSGPTVRITRMRSDIAHTAMTADFVLRASADQSELSNVRAVAVGVNETCTIYNASCGVAGTGTPAQAQAANTAIANAGGAHYPNGSGGASSGGSGGALGSNGTVGANGGAPGAHGTGSVGVGGNGSGCATAPSMSPARDLGGAAACAAWAVGVLVATRKRQSRKGQRRSSPKR